MRGVSVLWDNGVRLILKLLECSFKKVRGLHLCQVGKQTVFMFPVTKRSGARLFSWRERITAQNTPSAVTPRSDRPDILCCGMLASRSLVIVSTPVAATLRDLWEQLLFCVVWREVRLRGACRNEPPSAWRARHDTNTKQTTQVGDERQSSNHCVLRFSCSSRYGSCSQSNNLHHVWQRSKGSLWQGCQGHHG